MTTLTATTAAEQLLADVRHMLARHSGADDLGELREIADELSTALRRVRGRISRIAKREQPPAAGPSSVAPSEPRPKETGPSVAPSAVTGPAPSHPRGQHAPAAGAAPPAPGLVVAPPPTRPQRRRPRWWRPAVIIAAVLLMLAVLVAVARADGYLFAPSIDNPVVHRGCETARVASPACRKSLTVWPPSRGTSTSTSPAATRRAASSTASSSSAASGAS